MCLPKTPHRRNRRKSFTKLNLATPSQMQLKLHEYYATYAHGEERYEQYIEPAGDPLVAKQDDYMRVILCNINGFRLQEGFQTAPAIAAIGAFQADVACYTEINTNATTSFHDQVKHQLDAHLGPSQVTTASGAATKDGYLPGGVMQAIVGHHNGRVRQRAADRWGRFTWATMRGSRDEGIVLITAYRVCQRKGTKTTSRTAYQQQVKEMVREGIRDLDPRNHILKDISDLIRLKREEGYLPILLMDANEDWEATEKNAMRSFIEANHLVDAMRERHPNAKLPTYRTGSRLDYIFMDQAIIPAVQSIGQLGTHEGLVSDHVMLHMDLDERELFRGRLHRPADTQSREFTLSQADKAEQFLETFKETCELQNIPTRVFDLARDLERHGPTEHLVAKYQTIDNDIREGLLSAARSSAKKKFGYQRSPALTTVGAKLLMWKSIQSSVRRKALIPPHTIQLAVKHNLDPTALPTLSRKEINTEMRAARAALWEVQKRDAQKRVEWLETNAQNIARAAGDADWEKRMKLMIKTAQTRAMNRKLTAAIKGTRQGLNRIEIPTHDWFYSATEKELYRYDKGVFEAYSCRHFEDGHYYTHHHLKVLPDDATTAEVAIFEDYIALLTIFPISNFWKEITDQEEIEQLIMARNKRHLQQVTLEQGLSHHPIMQEIMVNAGDNSTAQALLAGTLIPPDNTPEAIKAWIDIMQQTPEEHKLQKVTGFISAPEFQEAFRKVKEFTSSSPSGVHYTLWKAVARDKDCAEFLSVMMSLPFMYGFTNKRWTTSVAVMLEKSPGSRKIHQLRIIELLEADLNTALKLIFAKRLMRNAESSGISDEQWGGRNNRSSIDAALQKLLTFEYGRYMKATIALFANDATACFDRMYPALSNVIGQKFGLATPIMHTRSNTIGTLKRALRTELGTSDATYANIPGDPRMEGECQGKGDVPTLWALTSHTILNAYAKVHPPMMLPDVSNMLQPIEKRNVSFVDDNDSWAGSKLAGKTIAKEVVRELKTGAQKWTNALEVVGQSMAFHKSAWQILSHEEVNGSLRIREKVPMRIRLHDSAGAYTKIRQLKSSEPNKGLGYFLTPDGNQEREFKERLEKTKKVCRGVNSIHTNEHETHVSLRARLIPQLKYGMHLTSFSTAQCDKLDRVITNAFLPRLRINRKSDRALVFGPTEMGGYGFPTSASIQDQCSLPYIIQTLRWDKILARDLLQTINAAQMASGFVTPIFELPEIPLKYIAKGWITHNHNRLRALGGTITVEDIWRPATQREHDESIMERVATIPNISLKQLIMTNECRIYMQVITIAELADLNGATIEMDKMQGKWRAQSKLAWPNQPSPTKAHWAAFRKSMRATFCPQNQPYQRSGEYTLTKRLGRWLDSPRHIQYQAYMTPLYPIWRDDSGIYKCSRKPVKGFYVKDTRLQSMPERSHPIQVTVTNEGLWTHKTLRLQSITEEAQPAPEVTTNTLDETTTEEIIVSSDGSAFLDKDRSSYAYKITQGRSHDKQLMATALVANDVERYAFRSELEGMYNGLRHADTIQSTRGTITQYCDCEGAVKRVVQPIRHPRDTMAPEADIVMAIQKTINTSTSDIGIIHIKGHQDNTTKYANLSFPSQCNVDCDELADDTIHTTANAKPFHPYPGYKAMLKLQGKWITKHFTQAIDLAHTQMKMEAYIERRLKLSPYMRKQIDWKVIGNVRKTLSAARQVRGTKLMYGHLPVGHNMAKRGVETNVCPGCGSVDETAEHLFQCENTTLTTTIQNGISHAMSICRDKNIPNRVASSFFDIALKFCKNEDVLVEPTMHPSIKRALKAQQQIGLPLFMRGFISTQWCVAMGETNATFPQWKTELLLRMLWEHVFEPMWTCRNKILHHEDNHYTKAEDTILSNKLRWYRNNQDIALGYNVRHFADIKEQDLQRWTRETKREWLSFFNVAEQRERQRVKQANQKQRVISSYFNPTSL